VKTLEKEFLILLKEFILFFIVELYPIVSIGYEEVQ